MKKIVIAVIATALTLGITPFAQASSTSVTKLVVKATGTNESMNKGAKTGSSSGTFILNESKNTLCSNVKTSGLTGVVASHIHKGAQGVPMNTPMTTIPISIVIATQSCALSRAATRL